MEQKNKNKNLIDVDVRDIARYLLSKIWIIAVVAVCFAVAAFLYTRHGIDEMYSSTTDMLILDTSSGKNNINSTNDWNVGQNLTFASPEIIKGDFCEKVAEMLNNDTKIKNHENDIANTVMLKVLASKYGEKDLNENGEMDLMEIKEVGFRLYFSKVLGGTKGITADNIRSFITVKANEDSPIVSVTATTPNAELSAVISNAVLFYYEEHVSTEIMGQDVNGTKVKNEFIKTNIHKTGSIPTQPSNISLGTNVTVAFVLGAVLVCAILIVIFLFDDKLKTPDDVEKRLGLSVLGAIPEIE